MNNIKTSILLKVLASFSFLLSTGMYLSLNSYSLIGYEKSIYDFSNILVYEYIFNLFVIIFIIVCSMKPTLPYNRIFLFIGFSSLVYLNLFILLLPVLKGYFLFGRLDIAAHIGYSHDILQYGKVSTSNMYPILHIFMAEVVELSNISINNIAMLLASFMAILYSIFLYLLASVVYWKRNQVMFATLASFSSLLSGYLSGVTPNGFALCVFPLIIYVYFKAKFKDPRVENSILLLIFIFCIPFMHPLATIILIVSFFLFEILNIVYNYKLNSNLFEETHNFSIKTILLLIVMFFLWISRFPVWSYAIKTSKDFLVGTGQNYGIVNEASDKLGKLGLNQFDFFELIVRSYGHIILFLIISMYSIMLMSKKICNREKNYKYLLFLIAYLFVIILMQMSQTSAIYKFDILRLVSFMSIVFPIFVGFVYEKIFRENNYKFFLNRSSLLFVILIIAIYIGSFSIYPSPEVYQPNYQVTKMDLYGTNWFFSNKNIDINYTQIMTSFYRLGNVIYGIDKFHDVKLDATIPDHFNYHESNTLSNSFDGKLYLPITKYDELIYTVAWAEVGRFNLSDFKKLEADKRLYHLYDNGEFDIWLIMPSNGMM